MENYCILDTGKIHGLLKEQDLKRWWVAECTGVHKTTLRRWLKGDIAKVHRERALSLAQVLEVPVGDVLAKA